jgi:hypothetical protein
VFSAIEVGAKLVQVGAKDFRHRVASGVQRQPSFGATCIDADLASAPKIHSADLHNFTSILSAAEHRGQIRTQGPDSEIVSPKGPDLSKKIPIKLMYEKKNTLVAT